MPTNIQNMVKQYSKIAEGQISNIYNINVWDNLKKEFVINTNLKFIPKTIFLNGKTDFSEPVYIKISKPKITYKFIGDSGYWFDIYITEITKDSIKFKFTDCGTTGTYAYLNSFFAIS